MVVEGIAVDVLMLVDIVVVVVVVVNGGTPAEQKIRDWKTII